MSYILISGQVWTFVSEAIACNLVVLGLAFHLSISNIDIDHYSCSESNSQRTLKSGNLLM